MPGLDFDPVNAKTSVFDRDRFKMDGGSTARIILLSKKAQYRWSHWTRNGKINEKSGEQGGEFIVCLGNGDVNLREGYDPDTCPLCRVSEPGRDVRVARPARRFAVMIAQYVTSNSGDLVDPRAPTFIPKAWVFAEFVYGQLAKLVKEFGDLSKRDLVVTTGKDQYKKMTITVGNGCIIFAAKKGADGKAVAVNPNALARYKEVTTAKDFPSDSDLELLCGNLKTMEALEREADGAVPKSIRENDVDMTLPDQTSALDGIIDSVAPEVSIDDGDLTEEAGEVNVTDLLADPVEAETV